MSRPPSNTPALVPAADTALHTPSARARSDPSGNCVVMIVSVAGASTAAPSPLRERARMSVDPLWAKPPARLAAVKMPSPIRNTRRRPNKSAARPPSSRRPANVSV